MEEVEVKVKVETEAKAKVEMTTIYFSIRGRSFYFFHLG